MMFDDSFAADEPVEEISRPARARGRGRGRAVRARGRAAASSRGRGKSRANDEEISIDDDEATQVVAAPERAKATRARGVRGRAAVPAAAAPAQSNITQAFARQSQSQTLSQRAAASSTPLTPVAPCTRPARKSTSAARGVCYISDSD